MKIIKNLFLLIILNCSYSIYAVNSNIILFLKKYPALKLQDNDDNIESLSKKLQQPGYHYKKVLKKDRNSNGVDGVTSLYLGYACLSDRDGQITFPRIHQRPIINLLITESIQPVYILAPSTIHNWMLDTQKPSSMYQFKFSRDQETELYYIEATKMPIPEDNMIPLETIIIFADPKNVFVPEGATISQYSANLVLPQIYIKKNFDYSYNALYTLSIKHYFDSIHSEYKPEDQTIARLIR